MPEGEIFVSNRAQRVQQKRAKTKEWLALRKTDPEALSLLLAQNCVKRGVRWLNRHAPTPGWWRNCLDAGRSRVRINHDINGVLALAFEYERSLANEFGYVSDITVLRKYNLATLAATRLGFVPWSYIIGWKPFPRRHPNVHITTLVLDKAWALFLENPPSSMRINYRHQVPLFHQRDGEISWREFWSEEFFPFMGYFFWPPNWFRKNFWHRLGTPRW